MALKGSRKGQQTMADPEPEPFETETAGTDEFEPGENASTDTDAGTGASAAPRRTYNRGPQLEWTREREEALARVLKAPKTLGDIRTARSVADALAQDPAFENEPLLTPEAVKAWVDLIKKMYAEQNREHPAYLNFDRLRKRVPTMSLFDVEETGDDTEEGTDGSDGGETESED